LKGIFGILGGTAQWNTRWRWRGGRENIADQLG